MRWDLWSWIGQRDELHRLIGNVGPRNQPSWDIGDDFVTIDLREYNASIEQEVTDASAEIDGRPPSTSAASRVQFGAIWT